MSLGIQFPVIILAGGLATRLRPITEKIPKALVDVAGEPFIIHQLRYIKNQGAKKVVLCLGYLGEQVQSLLGDGSRLGLEIQYSFDGANDSTGNNLLGTGGALKKALHLVGEEFFVLYGDSFLPINFLEVEKSFFDQKKIALMTVLKNENKWDKSNVYFYRGNIELYDKTTQDPRMNYIDYGLSILSASVLKSIDEEKFDLSSIFHRLSLKKQLAAHEAYDRFYEIGSHQGLSEARTYFESQHLTKGF